MYRAIVNALIPAEPPCTLRIERTDWAEVVKALAAGTPHYVRHPSTAKLMGYEPSSGFYEPTGGHAYLVVRLKPGTAPRGTEVEVQVDDLDVLRVEVTA